MNNKNKLDILRGKMSSRQSLLVKTTVATSIALMMMSSPITAQAQTVTVVTDCADLPEANLGDENSALVINLSSGTTDGVCTAGDGSTSQGATLLFENETTDGLTISVESGTTLENDSDDDDQTVFFIDNNEDGHSIFVNEGASLLATDGAVYFEGDNGTLDNSGSIIGEAGSDQAEGLVYIDRDVNGITTIENSSTGIISSGGGFAIGVDTLLSTVEVVVINEGIIEVTAAGSGNGDSDAINFDGNPGNTGGQNRGCLENATLSGSFSTTNCRVDLTLVNSGTISTARDNANNAAIRVENDAIIDGTIINASGANITGANTGIIINGAHGDHDLAIINDGGTIEGTSNTGVLISGAGVSLTNLFGGTIIGGETGVTIEDIAANTIRTGPNAEDVETTTDLNVLATNNTFVNGGTISGADASFDASGAATAFTFEQQGGGTLTGDFVGSAATDTFNVTAGTGDFTLTHDITGDVNVNVASGAGLAFAGTGARSIDGDLISDGDLAFTLGDPTVAVTGDATLNAGSTVTVTNNNQVTASGEQFTLLTSDGTLTNNATLSSDIDDTLFLLDFVVVAGSEGSLVVETTAAGDTDPGDTDPGDTDPDEDVDLTVSGIVSETNETESENFNALVSSLDAANFSGQLDISEPIIANLNDLNPNSDVDVALFASSAAGLLPDLTNSTSQEAFEAIKTQNAVISQRFNNLTSSASVQESSSSSFANIVPAEYVEEQNNASLVPVAHNKSAKAISALEAGLWVQASFGQSDQDGDTSLSSVSDDYTADSDTFSIGYDIALDDTTLVGISGGFSDIDVDLRRTADDEAEIDTYQITAYALRQYGALQVNGRVGYIDGDVDSSRTILGNDITSSYDLSGFNLQIEANYTYQLGKTGYFTPLVSVQYADISQDSYTEEGGLNLEVSSIDNDYFEGRLGFRIGEQIVSSHSVTDLFLSAAVVSNFGGDPDDVNVDFSGQTTSLSVFDTDDTYIDLGLGVNWYTSKNYSISASLNGEFNSDYTSVDGRIQFKYSF